MARQIRDMVVVITGASAGIGRALSIELAGRGARLVLAARRLDRLAELCATLGGEHLPVQADVADPTACASLIARASEEFGRIDTLVCNAGFGLGRSVAQTSHEQWQQIIATNVFGTTDCIEAAVPIMQAQALRDGWRGQVMIVSSSIARRGIPFMGAYAATKAAQLSLAEAMRVELKPVRIAVTTVHPIGTATDFFTTAASLSRSPVRPHGYTQSVEVVARKMARAIVRPRPEVWPMGLSRIGLNLAVFVPGLTDFFLGRMRDEFADRAEKATPPPSENH
jgi:NADP-dependent 3-hydroxy acid dehydrogenase YdfG